MIYTITFNPALDCVMEVKNFNLGLVNRSKSEYTLCGGKGINVSNVLKNLGVESEALGFVAGFTGYEIENRVNNMGINNDFIKLNNGESRINVKIKSDVETEINGTGPTISKEDLEALYKMLGTKLKDGDVLILAGSIPSSITSNVYGEIMKRVTQEGNVKNIKVVVDASKDLLVNTLTYKPFLVKPNHHELGEICGVRCETVTDVMHYGRKIMAMGAENVLVSMAGKGAVLITNKDTFYMKAPKGEIKNSVGAGDSMVAGFVAKYMELNEKSNTWHKEALRYAIAAGSASAFSENLATKEEVERMLEQVEEIS